MPALKQWNGTSWEYCAGTPGATGAQGSRGPTGNDGVTGTQGASYLVGQRAPTGGDGADGDTWSDETTGLVYGPKASGTWPAPRTVNATAAAPRVSETSSFTVDVTLAWKIVDYNSASDGTATLDAAAPAGTQVWLSQSGAGRLSLVAGTGATLHTPDGYVKTEKQYASCVAWVESNAGGAAVWRAEGRLAP